MKQRRMNRFRPIEPGLCIDPCQMQSGTDRSEEYRRNNQRPNTKTPQRSPQNSNVIQIRMTERELELKWVPVSFFVKKIAEKG